METLNQNSTDLVIASLLNQNLKFEAFSNVENRDTYIGISTKQAHWDWFIAHTYYSGNVHMDFDHTYNQNIGKSRKSIMHKIRTKERYEKMLSASVSFFN